MAPVVILVLEPDGFVSQEQLLKYAAAFTCLEKDVEDLVQRTETNSRFPFLKKSLTREIDDCKARLKAISGWHTLLQEAAKVAGENANKPVVERLTVGSVARTGTVTQPEVGGHIAPFCSAMKLLSQQELALKRMGKTLSDMGGEAKSDTPCTLLNTRNGFGRS